jgi:hypothetical protein
MAMQGQRARFVAHLVVMWWLLPPSAIIRADMVHRCVHSAGRERIEPAVVTLEHDGGV